MERVKAVETEKWDAAELILEKTELVLGCNQSETILVSHNGPGTASFSFQLDRTGVAELEWDEFVTKRSVPLTVTGLKPGETDVKIRLVYGPDSKTQTVILHITVIGAEPSAEDTEAEENGS